MLKTHFSLCFLPFIYFRSMFKSRLSSFLMRGTDWLTHQQGFGGLRSRIREDLSTLYPLLNTRWRRHAELATCSVWVLSRGPSNGEAGRAHQMVHFNMLMEGKG